MECFFLRSAVKMGEYLDHYFVFMTHHADGNCHSRFVCLIYVWWL